MTKKQLNYHFNKNKINDPKKIGSLMNIIERINPKSYVEWKEKLFKSYISLEIISELGQNLFDKIPKNENPNLSECKNFVYDLIVRGTYNGYKTEKYIKNVIEKTTGQKLVNSTSFVDNYYYVDLVSETDRIDYQIKPITFKYGNYKKTLPFEERQKEYCEKYNRSVKNIYYKKENNKIKIVNIEEITNKKTFI